MKKNNLAAGIVYVLIGILCLLAALLMNTHLTGLLCGFAGAGLASGCMMIYKYFYWASPKREKEYHEKLNQEQIELHDELKEKLRDKSGRYAYILGLMIAAVCIPIFAALDKLQIVESSSLLYFLTFFLIVQYIAGIVIFKHLLKKYE